MNTTQQSGTSPRDTFLTVADLQARYPWGRTKAYAMTKSQGFPRPIGGAYRLDTLIAWEDRVLAGEAPGRPARTSRLKLDGDSGTDANELPSAEQAEALLGAHDYVDPTRRRRPAKVVA